MTARTDAPIITLTSDFGLADPYVAAMKGVILGINPKAVLIDVTHDVQPQCLLQAVFLTQAAWPYFPSGTIHVAVVDPGVGTDRGALVLETPRGLFVGPDNGVLSSALPDDARSRSGKARPVELPAGYRAFAITERRHLREPVSATFHGRDVFAPAAAHASLGVPPDAFGERVEVVVTFPPLRAQRDASGVLYAQVLHIDRFGNIVTDARADDLPAGAIEVEIAGRVVPGRSRTYAEASGLTALVGSAGYLEAALPNANAAALLAVEIGAPVLVRAAR
jgi:S-adenosylmethionine hydrolase